MADLNDGDSVPDSVFESKQKPYLAYKTSHKGIECEVWWKPEVNGYGGDKSHYWLKVPKEITESDKDEWMAYNERDSLVCPTRPLWGLRVEQDTDFNWANWKHDDYVGGCTRIEITLYGKVVRRMGGYNNLFRSVAVAEAKILEMQEHQFDFADPDSMIGRRVWYYDQPAIIVGHEVPEDRMILKYDGPPQVIPGFGDEPRLGFNMLSAWKMTDKDHLPDSWHGSEVVHDSIFNEHMWWFRDEGQVCPPKKTGQQ